MIHTLQCVISYIHMRDAKFRFAAAKSKKYLCLRSLSHQSHLGGPQAPEIQPRRDAARVLSNLGAPQSQSGKVPEYKAIFGKSK